ncbi:MAG: MFS transporter [Planctomycetia bacterium]|nr:MFS transporter [Planctomycetia bacterium]
MASDTLDCGPAAVRPWLARLPIYYGWVNLLVAAAAMTATLPGRTHGLGMIAKPITEDGRLAINEQSFSLLNFWAILLGSLMCLPVGRAIDRLGVRGVLVAVVAALGCSVLFMSRVDQWWWFFLSLVLVRGLGQGALSVCSMAVVGKWFSRRLGPAMGVYAVLLTIGFMVSTVALGAGVAAEGWRSAWSTLGLALLAFAPICWLLVRSGPESIGDLGDVHYAPLDLPLASVLRVPAFWSITLATSLFNLVWSAITLFNESILAEQGLDHDAFIMVMAVLAFSGLPTNIMAGYLAKKWPMERILAIGMAVLALTLAMFPFVTSTTTAIVYAAGLGVSGGIVTVVFFAAYGHAFGRQHLGAIQAVVQTITVFASALGPVILANLRDQFDSYAPLFLTAAGSALVAAIACWTTRLDRRIPSSNADSSD